MSNPATTPLQENLTLLVRPGEETGSPLALWVGVGATLIVIGVVAWWLWRRRKLARLAPGAAKVDPTATALRELAEWESLQVPARYREAVAAISGTLRRYVEGRFGIPAPRLTTEEFWIRLRAGRQIPAQFDPLLADFLNHCDEIKYAGRQPDAARYARVVAAAQEFVRASGKETA